MTAKADLDKEQILALARDGWKITEIAGHFRVAVSTVYMYVTAEELQMSRAAGDGELRAKYHKRGETDSRVLIHMVESRLGEMPQVRGKLAEVSDEALAEEVRRRIEARRLIASGEWKDELTTGSVDGKKLLEATGEEKPRGEEDDEAGDPSE